MTLRRMKLSHSVSGCTMRNAFLILILFCSNSCYTWWLTIPLTIIPINTSVHSIVALARTRIVTVTHLLLFIHLIDSTHHSKYRLWLCLIIEDSTNWPWRCMPQSRIWNTIVQGGVRDFTFRILFWNNFWSFPCVWVMSLRQINRWFSWINISIELRIWYYIYDSIFSFLLFPSRDAFDACIYSCVESFQNTLWGFMNFGWAFSWLNSTKFLEWKLTFRFCSKLLRLMLLLLLDAVFSRIIYHWA